jgi:hypothetical protein
MTGLLQVLAWVAFAAACVVAPRVFAAVSAAVNRAGAQLAGAPRWEHTRTWLVRAAPTLTWMAVAFVLTWPLLFSPPMSRDHAIHYYFTRLWLDDVVTAGEVSGWSDRFNAGIPIGDSYGWLSYAWSSALHVLSFGLVPLRTSYALSILALWWSSAAVVAAWSNALASELFARTSDSAIARRRAAWAGSAAAIAWLVDPGAARQGGWNYVMFHGVWPQQLSTMLTLLALTWGFRLFERPRDVRLPAAALAVAASLVAHPFALIVLAVLAVLVPVVRAFDDTPWPRGAGLAWMMVFVLGGVAASGFLATFFASAGSMGRSPVPWQPLGVLAAGLVRGDLFMNPAAFVGPLGVVGVLVALWRGGPRARVTVVAVLGFVLLASEASVTLLGLDLFVPGLKNLQFPRFAFVIKPLLASLAGLATIVVCAGAYQLLVHSTGAGRASVELETATAPSPLRVVGGEGSWWGRQDLVVFVLGLVLAPFVVTLLREPGHLFPRPVGHVPTVRASGLAGEERALHETLLRERDAVLAANEGPFRVAYLRGGSRGGTYPLFALADVGAAVVLDGHVPSVNFEPALGSHSPDVLRALGVTHVVFDGRLSAREPSVIRELDPIDTHGPFTVARLVPGRVAPLPNAARVIERDAGRWVVEVGTAGGTVLVPPYRRWRATEKSEGKSEAMSNGDGEEVEVHRQRVWSKAFSVVKLARSGDRQPTRRIVLELTRTPVERALGWVSLAVTLSTFGWLGVLLWQRRTGGTTDTPRSAVLREDEPVWARRAVQASAALGLLAYVVASLVFAESRLLRTWESAFERVAKQRGTEVATPARDLVADASYRFTWSGLRSCDGLLDRDARAGCDPARDRPTVRTAYRSPYLHRCVEVPVAPGGRAELIFEGLREDETVVFFARRDAGDRRGLTYAVRGGPRDDAGDGVELARDQLHGYGERSAVPEEHRGTLTLRFDNRGNDEERPCVAAATARRVGE